MKKQNSGADLPLGLGMALAQNVNALNNFAMYSGEKKKKVIERAGAVASKEQMQAVVSQIADGSFK